MNVEQRLVHALHSTHRVEPSLDLWSRVVHSIEEDHAHRRRLVKTIGSILLTAIALVTAGALSIDDGRFGRFVHRPTMEQLEVIALATLLMALGPAIRRFGRGYASDLWPVGSVTPTLMLRLLDLAYYLVGAGYILLSTQFDFADHLRNERLAEQLGDAAVRIGGLLLTLGLLHASTLAALPLVALIDNATRRHKPLPRWTLLILIPIGLAGLLVIQAAVGIGLSGG